MIQVACNVKFIEEVTITIFKVESDLQEITGSDLEEDVVFHSFSETVENESTNGNDNLPVKRLRCLSCLCTVSSSCLRNLYLLANAERNLKPVIIWYFKYSKGLC